MADYDFVQAAYYGASIAASLVIAAALPAIANQLKNCYIELKGLRATSQGLREDLKKEKGLVEKIKKE